MSKSSLTPVEGMQTNWVGLWWHPEYSGFSSECIDLSALRKFKGKVRLYMRKNKFYNGGMNGRPNYHFCLKDANSETFVTLEMNEDEDVSSEDERLYTREEVYKVIHGMEIEYGLEYGNNLIEDYVF